MRNVVELGGCPFVFSKSAPKTSHALGNANGHLGNEGDSGGAGSLCQVKFQPLFSWSDLEAEKMVAAIEKWKVGIPKMKAHRVALSTATIFFYEYVTFITRLSGKSYLSRGFWELPGKEQNSPGLCEKPTRGRRILSRWIFFSHPRAVTQSQDIEDEGDIKLMAKNIKKATKLGRCHGTHWCRL